MMINQLGLADYDTFLERKETTCLEPSALVGPCLLVRIWSGSGKRLSRRLLRLSRRLVAGTRMQRWLHRRYRCVDQRSGPPQLSIESLHLSNRKQGRPATR